MATHHPGPSNRGGRPSKFDEPSRPVTMTLPDRILARLREIDQDRARAVVKAVEAVLGTGDRPREPVSEIHVAENESLLVVADSRILRNIPWISLLEVAPGRHLLSLRDGVPIEKLEVTLGDLIETDASVGEADRAFLRTLLTRIRAPRRSQTVRSEQILVVRTADESHSHPSPKPNPTSQPPSRHELSH